MVKVKVPEQTEGGGLFVSKKGWEKMKKSKRTKGGLSLEIRSRRSEQE